MSRYDPLNSPYRLMPRASVEQMLQDLLQAEIDLMSGKKVVSATYSQGDGAKSVTYSPADLQQIRKKIAELDAFLNGRGRAGPMRVLF